MICVVALLYTGLCIALFAFQRSLIYYPQPNSTHVGVVPLTLHTPDGPVIILTRPVAGPDALLYFGGNAEDVSLDIPDISAAFPTHSIYLLNYPGYGGSSGSPTEKNIDAAALVLFDYVSAEHPNVSVIGRSLGTGVAVHLATIRPVTRLVLVTPFATLADPAAGQYPYFPVRWLLLDRFDSWQDAPQVTAPTHIIAAGEDQLVPRASTERLRDRFKPGLVSYTVVPGAGHNSISDVPGYWSLLQSK